MVRPTRPVVIDDSGLIGTLDPDDLSSQDTDRFVALTRQDGTIEHVPMAALAPSEDGNFRLDRSRCAALIQNDASTAHAAESGESTRVLPIIEETAEVTKRTVPAGTTRIEKHVHEDIAHFTEQLARDHVDVQRVPINKVIDRAPDVRIDGDTTIIPILEERVVKVLVLREEVRITRKRDHRTWEQDVPLRKEEIHVERTDAGASDQTQPQMNTDPRR